MHFRQVIPLIFWIFWIDIRDKLAALQSLFFRVDDSIIADVIFPAKISLHKLIFFLSFVIFEKLPATYYHYYRRSWLESNSGTWRERNLLWKGRMAEGSPRNNVAAEWKNNITNEIFWQIHQGIAKYVAKITVFLERMYEKNYPQESCLLLLYSPIKIFL